MQKRNVSERPASQTECRLWVCCVLLQAVSRAAGVDGWELTASARLASLSRLWPTVERDLQCSHQNSEASGSQANLSFAVESRGVGNQSSELRLSEQLPSPGQVAASRSSLIYIPRFNAFARQAFGFRIDCVQGKTNTPELHCGGFESS